LFLKIEEHWDLRVRVRLRSDFPKRLIFVATRLNSGLGTRDRGKRQNERDTHD
jgi:hypothetical protein